MIPLLTADEVRSAEKALIEAGVPESELMLRAGVSIADKIDSSHAHPGRALILSGPGNNGGDGVVVASRLIELGWAVDVWTWNRERVGSAPVVAGTADSIDWVESEEQFRDALSASDVVVDAVFGAGGRAELPDPVKSVFAAVETERDQRRLDTWALDLPSGIDSTTGETADGVLPSDLTAMIGLPKIGAFKFPAASYTGFIVQVDIGLSPPENIDAAAPRLLGALDARSVFPSRRAGLHKRSAGVMMVVGGAPNYFGAPRLSGEAALRSGSGLVSIAAPSSIIGPIASAVPELTFVPLPVAEHTTAASRMANLVRERMSEVDSLVIGPGLGMDAPVPEFLSALLCFGGPARAGIGFGSQVVPEPAEPFAGSAVLDADALNWLATQPEWWEKLSDAKLVLTPHAGELARLLDCDRDEIEGDPWAHARNAASRFGQVVVLKHGHSVVATPNGRLLVADQAPTSLATAGSGDVLAGIIGSFLSQGCEPEPSAIAGVVLGLRATAIAEESFGTIGILASDIIRCIPRARDEISLARTAFE